MVLIFQTQVQDSDILKFATTTFNDHAYCATPRNSNTPVKDFELVDDLREEGDEKAEEDEKPVVKRKGKKKKGPAPGTRYIPHYKSFTNSLLHKPTHNFSEPHSIYFWVYSR